MCFLGDNKFASFYILFIRLDVFNFFEFLSFSYPFFDLDYELSAAFLCLYFFLIAFPTLFVYFGIETS